MAKKVYIDGVKGTIEEVELTAAEVKEREDGAVIAKEKHEAFQAKMAKKEADSKSGNQKFLDMGLTQDETTALTGYTPPSE